MVGGGYVWANMWYTPKKFLARMYSCNGLFLVVISSVYNWFLVAYLLNLRCVFRKKHLGVF